MENKAEDNTDIVFLESQIENNNNIRASFSDDDIEQDFEEVVNDAVEITDEVEDISLCPYEEDPTIELDLNFKETADDTGVVKSPSKDCLEEAQHCKLDPIPRIELEGPLKGSETAADVGTETTEQREKSTTVDEDEEDKSQADNVEGEGCTAVNDGKKENSAGHQDEDASTELVGDDDIGRNEHGQTDLESRGDKENATESGLKNNGDDTNKGGQETEELAEIRNGSVEPEEDSGRNKSTDNEDNRLKGDDLDTWKIDYIRVETPEKEKAARHGEKHKKKKGSKQRSSENSRRQKALPPLDVPGQEFRGDLSTKQKNRDTTQLDFSFSRRSDSQSGGAKKPVRKAKSVKDWRKLLKINQFSDDKSTTSQLFDNCLPPFNALSSHAHQHLSLIEAPKDVDVFTCPGCRDSFMLPTTFFGHVYRASVRISFECRQCNNKELEFNNKCLLRMHILNHLEADEVGRLAAERLDLMPLASPVPCQGQDVRESLKGTFGEMYTQPEDQAQCSECFSSLGRSEVGRHFLGPDYYSDLLLPCRTCGLHLPTRCSLSAHEKIHSWSSPYICPECGDRFYTREYFRRHVVGQCFHNYRACLYTCPLCPDGSVFYPSSSDLPAHLHKEHTKMYWKCPDCRHAFTEREALRTHCASRHNVSRLKKYQTLYRSPLEKKVTLFNSKDNLIKSLEEKSKSIRPVFVYLCAGCDVKCLCVADIEEHLRNCTAPPPACQLFPDVGDEHKSSARLHDELLRFDSQIKCQDCAHISKSLTSHIKAKHLKATRHHPHRSLASDGNAQPVPVSGRTRKRKSDPDGEACTDDAALGHLDSPPLKMKIKLTPEISKALDYNISGSGADRSTPEGVRIKGQKVKFSEPSKLVPVVEPLGVDVPNGRSLILINQLFHSPNAFQSGSTVRRVQTSGRYSCSVCSYRTKSRETFQRHIASHKAEEGSFQCKECGACFIVEVSWRRHLLLMHRIRRPDPEDYCQDLALFKEEEEEKAEEGGEGGEGEEEQQEEEAAGLPSYHSDSGSESGKLVIDTGEEAEAGRKLEAPFSCSVCAKLCLSIEELQEHVVEHGLGERNVNS